MIAMVTFYIRSPEFGRFVGHAMGLAFFEDAQLDVSPQSFCCQKCALDFIDTWNDSHLKRTCFVEEGIL